MLELNKPIMKKMLILALSVLAAELAISQTQEREFKPFKVDVSLGYANPQGSGSKGGVLATIEPKYALMDQFSLGIRLESAAMARAALLSNDAYVIGDVSANISYLITGDYYFTNNSFRPLVGGGFGLYSLAAITASSNAAEIDIPAFNKFGFMLRTGFEVGHFRAGIEYNFIGKEGLLKNSYFGAKLGVVLGGGRYKTNVE